MTERLTMRSALVEHEHYNDAALTLFWTEFGAEITLGIEGRIYNLFHTSDRDKADTEWWTIVNRYEEAPGYSVSGVCKFLR